MRIEFGDLVRRYWSMSAEERCRNELGFTLIELMVVLIIIGILASQVVTGWMSSEPKVKNAAFAMRNDFNYARGEAASKNENVLIDFFTKGESMDDAPPNPPTVMTNDGYRICFDNNLDNSCLKIDDEMLKEVVFRDEVRYYDRFVSSPAGPDTDATEAAATWNGNSVTFSGGYFMMKTDGTSNKPGSVYLYVPNQAVLSGLPAPASGSPDPPELIDAEPIAVVVSTIGRIRLARWRSYNSAWGTK